MSPSSTSTSTTTKIQVWRSPLPYLFGGLGIMLLLITVALFMLVCSYRKRSATSSSSSGEGGDDDEEKPSKPTNTVLDSDPKIVVIMAGDDQPTYLATPAGTTNFVCCACSRGTDEQV